AGGVWVDKNDTKDDVSVDACVEGACIQSQHATLDTRIGAVGVSGYFDNRKNIWQEPIDRNVFGLLEQFGDAELAAMVVPRKLVIEAAKGPELKLPSDGGAPARLVTPAIADVRKETDRAIDMVHRGTEQMTILLRVSGDGSGPPGSDEALTTFRRALAPDAE